MASEVTSQITGAQSLVKSLEAAGVDVMFGLPGGAILPAYDPISVSYTHLAYFINTRSWSVRHLKARSATNCLTASVF